MPLKAFIQQIIPPPPAVAWTGISEEMVLVYLYKEFNCETKEKTAGS